MPRRSLKPQLNQIRTWVREGRTDAWIAHQLEAAVGDIRAFKREHDLATAEATDGEPDPLASGSHLHEPDLRAEDEALVAAELDAEPPEADEGGRDGVDADHAADDESSSDAGGDTGGGARGDDDDDDGAKPRRRRSRRGGRGRGRSRKQLEGTLDHGDEGYGLWLDPAVQDDSVYAEHWAGHRPVTVTVEPDRIVIRRAGESSDDGDGQDSS